MVLLLGRYSNQAGRKNKPFSSANAGSAKLLVQEFGVGRAWSRTAVSEGALRRGVAPAAMRRYRRVRRPLANRVLLVCEPGIHAHRNDITMNPVRKSG
jgi:hypothetical protein